MCIKEAVRHAEGYLLPERKHQSKEPSSAAERGPNNRPLGLQADPWSLSFKKGLVYHSHTAHTGSSLSVSRAGGGAHRRRISISMDLSVGQQHVSES